MDEGKQQEPAAPGRIPLLLARPSRQVGEMSEAELDAFAKWIVNTMRAN